MTIQLESLVVPLKLDKVNFTGGMSDVTKLAAVGFGAIVAGAGAVAAGIKKAIDMTVKWGDEMDALQDVTNLTNDEAAGLNFLLRKHGVSADSAAKSFTFLNKNLVEYDGQLGSTGKALKNWGIDVKNSNGEMKTNAELTEEMAKRYRQLEPGAERVAFLTETFGKSSLELNDALLELADKGFDSFIDRAKKLGLNLDADKVQEYKQATEEMKLSWEAIGIFLGSKFMPVAQKVTEWLTNEAIPKAMDFAQRATAAFEKDGLGGLADFVLDELGKLDKDIAKRLDEVDWGGLGKKFGDWAAEQLSKGLSDGDFIPKTAVALTDGIDEAIRAAGMGTSTPLAWSEYWRMFFDNAKRAGDPPLRTFFIDWEVSWTNGMRDWISKTSIKMAVFFGEWEITWTKAIRKWGISVYNELIGWINKLEAAMGGNWMLPTISTGGGGLGKGKKARATGGAVLSGVGYDTVELNRPEVFTPFTAGRIDPVNQKPVEAYINETRLGRIIGAELAKVLA